MCGNCKLYLQLSFLGLVSLASNFYPKFITEAASNKSVTKGIVDSGDSGDSGDSDDSDDVVNVGNRVVAVNSDSCVIELSRLYLAAINSLKLHPHTIGSATISLLKDHSYDKPNLADYNWLTDILTTDSFEAHSLSTGERLKVTLKSGIPTFVEYYYFDDCINYHLCNLQLHGSMTIATSHSMGDTVTAKQRVAGNYTHGVRSGPWLFESDSHSISCHYQDGKRHGLSTSHHRYINRKVIENWSAGKLHGQQLTYDNNKLTAVNFYRHDRLLTPTHV